MGLSAYQRRRELADEGKMQGDEEAKAKARAAGIIAKGELPNPVDSDKPMPSTIKYGFSPSREAEDAYLDEHGVDSDDPPKCTEDWDEVEVEPTNALPEPRMQVDKDGKDLVAEAKKNARSSDPPTVLGAAKGQEPKDRAFTQNEKGTVGATSQPAEDEGQDDKKPSQSRSGGQNQKSQKKD